MILLKQDDHLKQLLFGLSQFFAEGLDHLLFVAFIKIQILICKIIIFLKKLCFLVLPVFPGYRVHDINILKYRFYSSAGDR